MVAAFGIGTSGMGRPRDSTQLALIGNAAFWLTYRLKANDSCLRLLRQAAFLAEYFAEARVGNRIAAKMAIMAMTTKEFDKGECNSPVEPRA